MSPEQLIDETMIKFGEYFETYPESDHPHMLIGVFSKTIIDQKLYIEYLLKRIEGMERENYRCSSRK